MTTRQDTDEVTTRYDTDEHATDEHARPDLTVDPVPGADAEAPHAIPRAGWKQVLGRVKDEIADDNVVLLAGGVALFGLLAIPPAIVAAVALWGLFADPSRIAAAIDGLSQVLPASTTGFLTDQIQAVAASSDGALGWGFAVGLIVALWSASSGMKGLINAVNAAYDERESRGFLALRGMALGLTFGAVVFGLVTVGLIAAAPVVVSSVSLPGWLATLLLWGRWPLLAVAMIGAVAALYHYAPDRPRPRWRWVTPGAVAATVLWLVASAGFAWYAAAYGQAQYQGTYGTMASLVVFMLWLLLTVFAVLLGAELNAELEHQTGRTGR